MKNKIYCNNTFQIKAKDIALNSLFDLFPINFCWMDREGYILGCNQKMIESLGKKSFTELIGKHTSEIGSEIAWENSKKVIETGEPITAEEIHLKKDGTLLYFLSMKSPMKDCNDKIIGVVNIALDITERKSMEMNLIQLKEAAELANNVKTEFLTNMRHDLRTPLSGIVTISEFLQNSETESMKINYLQDIKNCAESMLTLLNEILDHIKVESGEFSVVEKEFNIHQVLKDVYTMLLPTATSKGIAFTLTLDYIPSDLIGDAARTQRILMNLIANAIKFTDEGYVKVLASWFPASNGKGILQFIIEDTGIGIPSDKKDVIFEKFSRLSPSPEGLYTGNGLGLSIVKQFIEELNGDYELKSELGIGTSFKVRLPFKVPFLNVKYDKNLSIEDFSPPPSNLIKTNKLNAMIDLDINSPKKRYNVLLVEDNPIISRISKDLLESLGCRVDLAMTGKSALEFANHASYDVVLMDIGLPDIDGYTVTEKIRRGHPNVPVIAITAHSEDEEKQRCFEVGMSKMITKPLTEEIAKSILSKLS